MNKTERLGYPDLLRCLAAFSVVVVHCAGASLAWEDVTTRRFAILNFYDGAAHWCVWMFVMLSGMFLLDPEKPLPRKKWLGHVGRIALATVVWGFLYALWDAKKAHLGLELFLEALIAFLNGPLYYHLWFLPMLLGLYLLIPVLRALIQGASRGVLWYFTGLWFLFGVCFRTLYGIFPGALGNTWVNMLQLLSLWGYAGLFLLGYLLKTCERKPLWEYTLYALGLVSLFVTTTGTRLWSQAAGSFQGALYGELTPNLCLMAAALFLLCRRLEAGRHPIWHRLAPLTFGVYLLHPLVLETAAHFGFPASGWNSLWAVPIQALAVFALSLALAWLIRRIPWVGKTLC